MNEKIEAFLSYLQKFKDDEEKLKELQVKEAKNVILRDNFPYPPNRIAGIDVAYHDDAAFTACVTLNYEDLKPLETKVSQLKLIFPYKSGYFIFREGPPILSIISRLEIDPDVILINSHGINHPLGIGAASHIGILIEKATIGVAQNKLCGDVQIPKKIGDYNYVYYQNKIVGVAYLSKLGKNPLYISPGHLVTLETSIKIIRDTTIHQNQKLPEPLWLAHELANKYKSQQLI